MEQAEKVRAFIEGVINEASDEGRDDLYSPAIAEAGRETLTALSALAAELVTLKDALEEIEKYAAQGIHQKNRLPEITGILVAAREALGRQA